MKTRLFILSICAVLISLGTSAKVKDGKALTGSSQTEFGKYMIVKSEAPMAVENNVIETYDLTYENIKHPIQIGVLKEKKCTTFIVKSDEFEVEYCCDKGVFGVKKIERRFRELPLYANNAKMDRSDYFAQRVICQSKSKNTDDLLGLIACYFPGLINEQYHVNFIKN